MFRKLLSGKVATSAFFKTTSSKRCLQLFQRFSTRMFSFMGERRRNNMPSSIYFTSGLFLGISAVTTVACKPMDTPDYLLPYYLRDTRSRFNRYASIKKKSGRRFMTPEDFLCALLASPKTTLDDPRAVENIGDLFNVVDRNGDGKLSFGEFSFLMVLLSTSKCDFRKAFKMFDNDMKGTVSKEEFQDVVLSFGDGSSCPSFKGGLMEKLFGPKLNHRCTFEQFWEMIEDLHTEVSKAEFRQYDPKGQGTITGEQFGKLISNSMLGSHLPFFIVDNLRKLKSDGDLVPFSTWQTFSSIMRQSDELGEAIQMYTSAGLPFTRKDMARAISAVGLPKLQNSEIDLIFTLFDRNGDGTLEYDEFLSIMGSKVSFHVLPNKRGDRENLFVRMGKCVGEVVAGSSSQS